MERALQRLEGSVGQRRKVKDEEKEEVVEVAVEEGREKEEIEEKVMEVKVDVTGS